MKHLALTITTTLATLAVIMIVWQLRSIVLLFLFSILIAAVLRAPIDHLIQRRLRPWLAMTLAYSMVLLGLLGLAGLLAWPIARELDSLVQDLVGFYERGYSLVDPNTSSQILRRLPPTEVVGEFLLGTQPTALVRRILGFTQTFAFFMGQAVLAVVISIYWTADHLHFERMWLSLLAPEQRTRMRDLWYTIEENVGAYIRSEIVQSVLAGALLTLGFWATGIKYPFLLAAIGAVAWFIPLVGALFAIPLIVIIAWVGNSYLAIAAAIYTIGIFALMEFGLEPRLYDRRRYGTILVIVVMMAMVDALGLLGLLLAPPLALSFQIILDEYLNPSVAATPAALTLHDLEAQLAEVRTIVGTAETESPRVANMVERLDELLQETQKATA